MGARDDHIDKIKMDIVDTEKEMKSATFKLEERRSAIRTEAFGIAKDLEESGSKKADEIFASAQEEIAILIEKANKEVDAQIIEVRKHLKEESEALAVNVMDKILDRRLVV
jgi:F-type H+-transporting ATPase subunit b